MGGPRAGSGKVALVLGGGGITGGVYEIGVLKALDDFLINRSVNDFDIYVGVSAGSLVAAGLAAGLAPRQLVSVLSLGRGPHPPFRRADIYRLNWPEYGRRLREVPGALAQAAWRSVWPKAADRSSDLLESLTRVVPAGLLDISPLGEYLDRLLGKAGLPKTWDDLDRELYLPALDVDTGHLVVFGEVGLRSMAVSRAVCASAAIPFLFQPVRIGDQEYVDGGMDRNLPIEVAIRHGASLIIAVHPLVPLVNLPQSAGGGGFLSARGGTTILDQVYRTLVHGRERDHVESMREKYPEVRLLLIEPGFDDLVMFQYNVMRYAVRRRLAQHGYATTRRLLAAEVDEFRDAFAAHGMQVRDEIPERPSLDPEDEGWGITPGLVLDALERLPPVRRWLDKAASARRGRGGS